jgi:hypothetical protein
MVKRGRGRPTIGKRVSLGLRVTPQTKKKLDAAAEENGRSQSQEAELRIERSFDRADLLGEVLTLAYGEDIAADLMRLGVEMKARRHRREAPFELAGAVFRVCSDVRNASEANRTHGTIWPSREQTTAALVKHLTKFLVPDWRRVTLHAAAEESEEKTEKKFRENVVPFLRKAS